MNVSIPKEFKYYNSDMEVITDPKENEIGFIPELNKTYQYVNGEWREVTIKNDLNLSIYDLNKQIISQLPSLDEDGMTKAYTIIDEYVHNTNSKYFMLLCKDLNYYTVFVLGPTGNNCAADVLDCALDLGALKSVEPAEAGGIEIWTEGEDEPVVSYFFDYQGGIIECQK